MGRRLLVSAVALSLPLALAQRSSHSVRLSGTIQAIRSIVVQVPRIEGQGGNLTLTRLIANGATVHQGDQLADFDKTNELKTAYEAESKYGDLIQQVEQNQTKQKARRRSRAAQLLPTGQRVNTSFTAIRSSGFGLPYPTLFGTLNISVTQPLLQDRTNIQARAPAEIPTGNNYGL